MKIDLNYKFKTMDGKVVKERVPKLDEGENQIYNDFGVPQFEVKGDFTLRKIIEDTLFSPPLIRDPRTGQFAQISEEKKKACYVLLNRVLNHKDGLIDFESEETTLLKDLITKKFNSPWTIGQARDILDPHKAAGREPEPQGIAEEKTGKDN